MSITYNKIVLPYSDTDLSNVKNGVELGISKSTIDFHYGKHHTAYVTNLNNFAKDKDLKYFQDHPNISLDDIVSTIVPTGDNAKIFNNAAQIWNHDFYWKSLAKPASNEVDKDNVPAPRELKDGDLRKAIIAKFNDYATFKARFTAAATSHFGSGWAWLIYKEDGTVDVVDSHDAANPLNKHSMKDPVNHVGFPLLTCDVWEHAYYIDYRNARAQYINAWWSLINWEFAQQNYEKARAHYAK